MHRLLRYTLDLFAPAPQPCAPPASDPCAPLPVTSLQPDLASPAGSVHAPVFSHPQATRQALCEGMVVRYAFVRSRRRTIGFQVGPQGLSVRAPLRTPWTRARATRSALVPTRSSGSS